MRSIRLKGLKKSLQGGMVLSGIDLKIPSGKFFALLGPSGCGKTTLLRLIAGLEQADGGQIFLGERDITYLPIHERPINIVFQNYALFPHLDVFDNVAYSLKLKKLPIRLSSKRSSRSSKHSTSKGTFIGSPASSPAASSSA